jgi:hypothetical protein
MAVVILFGSGVTGCAGTEGRPDHVRTILSEKYGGKDLQTVIAGLGAPHSSFSLPNGQKAYTWRIATDKYQSNKIIKSDERCVITMLTDATGTRVETVGEVDDSLGAWQFSYCAEQLGLQ